MIFSKGEPQGFKPDISGSLVQRGTTEPAIAADDNLINDHIPDHVTFFKQITYSGNFVQTELPIERKPNQITFG